MKLNAYLCAPIFFAVSFAFLIVDTMPEISGEVRSVLKILLASVCCIVVYIVLDDGYRGAVKKQIYDDVDDKAKVVKNLVSALGEALYGSIVISLSNAYSYLHPKCKLTLRRKDRTGVIELEDEFRRIFISKKPSQFIVDVVDLANGQVKDSIEVTLTEGQFLSVVLKGDDDSPNDLMYPSITGGRGIGHGISFIGVKVHETAYIRYCVWTPALESIIVSRFLNSEANAQEVEKEKSEIL